MTKRKVNILIALMAVALFGIMVLQVVWMRNAMQVRNELFDRSVNEALTETSKRMEIMSDVFFVQDMIRPGHRMIQNKPPGAVHFNSDRFTINGDTVLLEYKTKTPGSKNREKTMKLITTQTGDSINHEVKVEIIQLDSVITEWEEKIDHNITVMFDNSLKTILRDSTIVVRKNELARKFDTRAKRLKDVAGRMIYETWVMDKKRIPDTLTIKKVLSEELQNRNVPIPFEMGVFSASDELLKTQDADSLKLVNANYSVSLNPNDIFDKSDKLSIYFPARKSFVFKTLIGPAVLSLLFCAFIMVVFGLSIFYILNQKKISEMKSDFINNMTHEFKTPLATISVATDTIVNPKVIDDQKQVRLFTDVIKKENLRMNQQVETILQIARLDKKDFEFNFKVVNIHELVEKAIQTIGLQVENRGGSIETRLNALNPSVTTDANHTLNMLSNLFDNANKYSTDHPEIVVSSRNSERGIWISVADKGIGMGKQVQQKIFEKFYRETSGNIHNVKGFGLGLSYAKAVVEANNGEIRVVSEPGKGSTFEVFLPFTIN